MNAPTLSLDQLPKDAHAVVRNLRGGGELVHRLASRGLTEGAQLVVLQNTGHGPMLVNEAIKVLRTACASTRRSQ